MTPKPIRLKVMVLILALSAGVVVFAEKKPGMSKKEQKNFQEGNRLLREYKYYEAAFSLCQGWR